jgi:predicted cobalt transporter CbtA
MMLDLVEYDKGYHTDQLEPMGTIFAWHTVSQIWRDFAGYVLKNQNHRCQLSSKAPSATKTMADHPKSMEAEAKEDQVSRAVQYISAVMIFLALNFAFLLKSLHSRQ